MPRNVLINYVNEAHIYVRKTKKDAGLLSKRAFVSDFFFVCYKNIPYVFLLKCWYGYTHTWLVCNGYMSASSASCHLLIFLRLLRLRQIYRIYHFSHCAVITLSVCLYVISDYHQIDPINCFYAGV